MLTSMLRNGRFLRTLLLATVAAVGSSHRAPAQCTIDWLPGAIPGTDGNVFTSLMWDPDGAGPAPVRAVIGGAFNTAAAATTKNIVTFEPVSRSWVPLGNGLDGTVVALAARSNGELAAVSVVSTAYGIRRWNGATWSPIGTGAALPVLTAITFLPNGDLVAAGSFSTIEGVAANNVARWDGSVWSPLGSGTDAQVNALLVLPTGDLVAGGSFGTAGGVVANRIARWDGTSWSPLGAGLSTSGGAVRVLGGLGNGELFAGGSFTAAMGAPASHLAHWDGASWSAFGPGPGGPVTSSLLLPTGHLFVATGDVGIAPRVRLWNSISWEDRGAPDGIVHTMAMLPTGGFSGSVLVGGAFLTIDGLMTPRIARWTGTWATISAAWNGAVSSSLVLPSGDVLFGGLFNQAAGVAAKSVVRWDGASWQPLGDSPAGQALAMLSLPNGDIVVAGNLPPWPPAYSSRNVGIWNGTVWSGIGRGVGDSQTSVQALARLSSGDLVAGGNFDTAGGSPASRIASWNGTSWTELGGGISGFESQVRALLVMPNGDLIAAGKFSHAGATPANCVARWNGSTWSPLGLGMIDPVNVLATTAAGDLIAAGAFNWAGSGPANRIARWNGSTWSALGAGLPAEATAITALPNGDLLVAIHDVVAAQATLQRWDGTSWSTLQAGLNQRVSAMAMMPSGALGVGGSFTTVASAPNAYFAQLATSCPPAATTFGAGCGTNVLEAGTLPWIGSMFRATGTGLPTVSIVLTLTSVTPIAQGAVPLTLAFSQAGAGCDVLTMPDLLGALVTTNGIAESQIFLPSTSPLVGIPFFHQMVPIEVDANGGWPSVVATNALQLVAGSF